MLASQLPREARTLRAKDPRLEWGVTDYLLALAIDNLAFMRYEMAGGKGRKPKPIKRPSKSKGAKRAKDRTVHGMSKAQVEAILSRKRI